MDGPDHAVDRTAGPMIRLDGVTKRYDDGTVAVRDLHLDVARGELVALVGPSGCGKSTTLRMVNRLVEPTSGRVVLDGVDVTHTDPVALRRGIGYVIQRVGLFPHLTVAANVACVPDLLGWPRQRVTGRVEELLDLVGLDPRTYAARYPHELSGGQQQRVGVARALAADPPVLLLDEPFGAVDPVARGRLQRRFRRIQESLHKTALFVTHDLEEAVRLADRIAVFSAGGVLEQVATPAELLSAPANETVAGFVGADRGIRRLVVTPVGRDGFADPDGWTVQTDDVGRLTGWRDAGGTTRPVPSAVGPDDSLHDALAALLVGDAGWVPVVDDGRYLGTLTATDIARRLR